MVKNSGFRQIKEERKKLSFFKIFQSADLSSESMRAIPYKFMRNVSEKDFTNKMMIKTEWGSSWIIDIDQNPRYHYMEKRGWYKFVNDNALGQNEFVAFTHRGNMSFTVNILEPNGKEILTPRRSQTTPPPNPSSSSKKIKTEQSESEYKEVKNEEEETGETTGGVELKVRKKKAKDSKTSNKKSQSKRVKVEENNTIPEFPITIKKSYLRFLAVPKQFADNHITSESTVFKIVHPNGNRSWKVLCLVRKTGTTFSRGWSKMAREYPLSIGDNCTLKLIEPNKLLLFVNPKEEVTMID